MSKVINCNFYYDDGHGWLEVSVNEYLLSGIKASRCSYIKQRAKVVNGMVVDCIYLEEDCDAPKFIDGVRSMGYDVSFKEYRDTLGIRSFERFREEYVS